MPAVSMSPKDRKCSLFPDPLLRGGSVLGATTPSRNDQDRKHVVVGTLTLSIKPPKTKAF